jgi:hypothetical protein
VAKSLYALGKSVVLSVVADPVLFDHLCSKDAQHSVAEADSSRIGMSSPFHFLETQASVVGIFAEQTVGIPRFHLNVLGKIRKKALENGGWF